MSDYLQISKLKTTTNVGIHDWEQQIKQTLLLDIVIPIQTNKIIDYDLVCQSVTKFIESNSFALIENVAEEVATMIKQTFDLTTINITVCKPNAIKNAGNVCIILNR